MNNRLPDPPAEIIIDLEMFSAAEIPTLDPDSDAPYWEMQEEAEQALVCSRYAHSRHPDDEGGYYLGLDN